MECAWQLKFRVDNSLPISNERLAMLLCQPQTLFMHVGQQSRPPYLVQVLETSGAFCF